MTHEILMHISFDMFSHHTIILFWHAACMGVRIIYTSTQFDIK